MLKSAVLLAFVLIGTSANVLSDADLLEKLSGVNANLKTDSAEAKPLQIDDRYPVFRADEQGRARIKPVRPVGPVVKHDQMLSDQPEPTELNRADKVGVPNYGYGPAPVEVPYPELPYAPGYGYEGPYPPNQYLAYGNDMATYPVDNESSTLGLLWSQMPSGRTLINYIGITIGWMLNSVFALILGSFLTISLCTYTNVCSIHFEGVPIHEEMRSLVTPERLEKISNAAGFVKSAIDKYQSIQTVEGKKEKRYK